MNYLLYFFVKMPKSAKCKGVLGKKEREERKENGRGKYEEPEVERRKWREGIGREGREGKEEREGGEERKREGKGEGRGGRKEGEKCKRALQRKSH
jgi:hypothetical protein